MNPREQSLTQRNEGEPWSEQFDDAEFYTDYQDPGKILDAISRLKIIKDLRLASNTFEEKDEHRFKILEYREAHPSPYGITLGIEVEIPKESVLPKESKEWSGGQKKKYLFDLKEKYIETEKIGIPKGEDQFWEFAQLPAHHPETLAREVQALIGMGLINPDYEKFPLHVTIGGIKNDEEAHVLARVLEATGWATTGDRLLAPYTDPDSNWTSHDLSSGMRGREMSKIAQPIGGEIKSAVELRTPILRSLFGLDRYLHSAYYLGSALRAYQEQKKNDPVSKQLAKAWRVFAGKCETRFEEAGLPSLSELWTLDTQNPDEHSPFKQLAKILDKGQSDPESEESKFIHDIRLLVISARSEIKDIMEKS